MRKTIIAVLGIFFLAITVFSAAGDGGTGYCPDGLSCYDDAAYYFEVCSINADCSDSARECYKGVCVLPEEEELVDEVLGTPMPCDRCVDDKDCESNTNLECNGGRCIPHWALGPISYGCFGEAPDRAAQECEDGTAFNTCSSVKPYYCDGFKGRIVQRGDICGCPQGQKLNPYDSVSCVSSEAYTCLITDPFATGGQKYNIGGFSAVECAWINFKLNTFKKFIRFLQKHAWGIVAVLSFIVWAVVFRFYPLRSPFFRRFFLNLSSNPYAPVVFGVLVLIALLVFFVVKLWSSVKGWLLW